MESDRRRQLLYIAELLRKEGLLSEEEKRRMKERIEARSWKGCGDRNGACRDL